MPVIGEWVIDEACRAVATWPEPITVALNISPSRSSCPALPNIVSEALARYKLPGNRIELEVTEGVFLGDNGADARRARSACARSASASRSTISAPAIRRSAI